MTVSVTMSTFFASAGIWHAYRAGMTDSRILLMIFAETPFAHQENWPSKCLFNRLDGLSLMAISRRLRLC